MVVQKKKLYYLLFCIFIGIIDYIICSTLSSTFEGVVGATLTQLVTFIICYIWLAKINKSYLSLYGIFMIVFYLFQNGQVLLYVIGVEYDYFYVERYGIPILLDSVTFSTICLVAALSAGIFSTTRKKTNKFYTKLDNLERTIVIKCAKVMWIPLAAFALPYMFAKLAVTSLSGYYAMIAFVSSIPSVINLIEKLFIGISVLLLIYVEQKQMCHKIIRFITIIWSLMATLTGDRTVGLAGLVVIAVINFLIGNKKKKNNMFWRYIVMIIMGIAIMYLISIAFSYRMQTGIEVMGIREIITETIGTLGFSFFPLVLVMRVCPVSVDYLYGKSFLGGFVHGLVPENIDILGITSIFTEWSSIPTNWIEEMYNYGFGIDFSLNAECYVNFGWYGWVVMFLLCTIIAKLLRQVDFRREDNLFSQYASIILLYSWFTLPRRKSYYIFNNFFWYVVIIGIVLLLSAKQLKNSKE